MADDIGQDDRDDAPGRSAAHVPTEQGVAEDQIRQVGGSQARAAAGGHVDLGEQAEKENDLDHGHHRHGPQHMGQLDVAEQRHRPAPSMRAASRNSGFSDCRAGSRISTANGVHSQATMTTMAMSGMWAKKSTVGEPERAGDPGEHAEHRIHQHVLPDQSAHRGHHEERRDHQQAADVAPGEFAVEEERQAGFPAPG